MCVCVWGVEVGMVGEGEAHSVSYPTEVLTSEELLNIF